MRLGKLFQGFQVTAVNINAVLVIFSIHFSSLIGSIPTVAPKVKPLG
jgi:hypothetical protein